MKSLLNMFSFRIRELERQLEEEKGFIEIGGLCIQVSNKIKEVQRRGK